MIVDTHTHFGDPARPNEILHRTALPEVYERLAVPEGVTGTVVVEARRGPDEIRWVADLAEKDPFILGIVADLDPASEDFTPALESFAGSAILKGVRLHDRCCEGHGGLPGPTLDRASRNVFASAEALVARDLPLDVHMTYVRMDALLRLVQRLPALKVVINHIAGGEHALGRGETNLEWADAMRRAAAHPRVFCKVSALVQMTDVNPAPADVDFYRPTLDVVWDAFGEDRLVYASNWPQIEATSDFATAHRIVAAYFAEKGADAFAKFFAENSRVVYGWVGGRGI